MASQTSQTSQPVEDGRMQQDCSAVSGVASPHFDHFLGDGTLARHTQCHQHTHVLTPAIFGFDKSAHLCSTLQR